MDSADDMFTPMGHVIDEFFEKKDFKADVLSILFETRKNIDIRKIEAFLGSLPEEQWTLNLVNERSEDIKDVFGINEENIKEWSIHNIETEEDMGELKWEFTKRYLLDFSSHANEFYDNLKYNILVLPMDKQRLLDELMLCFKSIKDAALNLYNNAKKKNFSKNNLAILNLNKLPLELLILRILYTFYQLSTNKKADINKLTDTLETERISLFYQQQ